MSDNTRPGGQPPSFGQPPAQPARRGGASVPGTNAAGRPGFSAPVQGSTVTPGGRAPADPTEPSFGERAADRAKDVFGSARGAMSSAATSVSSAASTAVSSVASTVSGDTDRAKDAVPGAPAVAARAGSSRRTRKARLRLSRIDPWSVMKTAFLFGIAGGIIFFISIWVLWGVIVASGVFESVNRAVNDLLNTPGAADRFHLEDYLNGNRVLGFAAMIGAADVVIFTALATLFSFLYNLAATVMGGLEVTLAED
ncbi:DUF3566 domain-containing protein [Aestuariimicrobium sp. T2.26MG-19.2B]|uniref:DUF3566 domain-containing protein n=1 Tax=Aestuariimicrobium sp. T2.26MG-19.2B TaxID=3040679 RepID=UPI0024777149|nr:hypothetical protein AESSP_01035 [Aestuariimicrobium sp. T2.26MG-19.2B]